MLESMAMRDVPFFINQMYKEKNDALQWDLFVNRYEGDLSFEQFKKEIESGLGSGLTPEQKVENEKEALDFAKQFITFANPK